MAFDEIKATQTAAFFLKLAGGRLEYLALIKLLYKLDREAMNRWGLPVTTDKYSSMKLGPVTSRIYNLIKESANSGSHPSFWSTHIHRESYSVVMAIDPSDSELSPVEEHLIKEVFAADGSKSGFKLADQCHRDFPEWQDPGGSSIPINISEILCALGKSEEETAHSEAAIGIQNALSKLSA